MSDSIKEYERQSVHGNLNLFEDFRIAFCKFNNSAFGGLCRGVICIAVRVVDGAIDMSNLTDIDVLKSAFPDVFNDSFANILRCTKFVKIGDNLVIQVNSFTKVVIFSVGSGILNKNDCAIVFQKISPHLSSGSEVHFLLSALNGVDQIKFMSNCTTQTYEFIRYKYNKNHCTKIENDKKLNSRYKFEFYNCDDRWNKEYEMVISICIAKTLGNYAPNDLYPMSYAKLIEQFLTPLGIKVTILDSNKIQALGMDALYSVGKGSAHKPCAVIMEWKNGNNEPVSLVGKGVTFDAGGISIKPSQDMEDMKFDMSGSGAVVGAMFNIAKNKMPVNVIGAIGLAENTLSGEAFKPADVIGSMSGKTIEVLNTDAEGRLVLADILWYVQDVMKSKKVIDLATLTGAVTVVFGSEYAAILSNDDEFSENFIQCARKCEEKFWSLPMDEVYNKLVDSKIADVKNISKGYKGAGTISAAMFLQRFIKNDTSWIHLDIAGVAYRADSSTGFGVRSLCCWVLSLAEV